MSTRASGVVTFAGVLFLIAAFFNAVDGIVAIAEPRHLYVGENGLIIDNYQAFGVVLLVVAGLDLFVGWGILARVRAAQVIGIIIALAALIVHFAYFKHFPAWASIMIVLNVVILYALTVHSDEFAGTSRR